MNSRRPRGTFLAAVLLILATCGGVFAHGGATGVVKERMDLMSTLGDSMKALKGQVMGSGEPDRAAIAREAARIAEHADGLTDKFPEGSLEGPSEAHPEIWSRWDEFAEAADALVVTAREMAEEAHAAEPATLRTHFAAIGKACAACHRDFRVKK